MNEKIPQGRWISSRNGALFGPARRRRCIFFRVFFASHRGCTCSLLSRPLGKKFSTLQRVRSATVQATKGTRIPIAAGTTRVGAVFAKITADGSEIQVLAATRARERPLAIRFGRAERREGKRRIRVRIKKIFVRIRPTRTFETLAVAVAITTPREAITATLSPLKSVQGKAFKRTQ